MSVPTGDAVRTAHLFRPLLTELMGLLRGLNAEQWALRTSAGAWSVKDVAAHLLDGELRRISIDRDAHAPPPPSEPVGGYEDLLRYLDELNAEWVQAARRLSPRVLCDWLEFSGAGTATLMEAADPTSEATFPVAWAGQTRSPMWLDVGREYTERWHHQDQIREAVGAPPLREEQWLRPALDVSLLALPHAYRSVAAARGTSLQLSVTGPAGGEWYLVHDSGWSIQRRRPGTPETIVRVADLDLMRLLMHRLPAEKAASILDVGGNAELARPLLSARAVMV